MLKAFLICLFALTVSGLPRRDYHNPRYGYNYAPVAKVVKVEKVDKPNPYDFSYTITDDDSNTQGREESGDANGNVKGVYQIQLANGLTRWVQYVADDKGFRAQIKTNEPGTDNQSPADVAIEASPVSIKEKEALKAPKPVVKKIRVAPTYGYHDGTAPLYRHHSPAYGYAKHY